jgi:hypothetical protein
VASSLAIFKLGRPHYLLSGFSLYALGAALAVSSGAKFHWGVWLLGALVIATAQSMTHYCNDSCHSCFYSGSPGKSQASPRLPAPLAVWHGTRLLRGAFRLPQRWESLAWCSVILLMATTLSELVGTLLVVHGQR